MDDCCENKNVKNISGIYTCVDCGTVIQSQIVHGWIDYNPSNAIRAKTVYSRNQYVKLKLKRLNLSSKEIEKFMEIWSFVESQLKEGTDKRFPKIDFFIDKTLEILGISKRPSYKISFGLKIKYEIIWMNILCNMTFDKNQKSEDTFQQFDHQE